MMNIRDKKSSGLIFIDVIYDSEGCLCLTIERERERRLKACQCIEGNGAKAY